MILLALAAIAAEGPAGWDSLNEAGVFEAAGGTPGVAARYCEEGLENTSDRDPVRGDLLYCVARNRLVLGDRNGAFAALRAVPASSGAWGPAHTLLDRLLLQERAIPRVPSLCTFDHDVCGFVRTWERLDKGILEPRDVGDLTALAWDTTVKESEDDRISVAFATDATVRGLSFRAMATRFPADLRVYLVEGSGRRYLGPVIEVPTGGWVNVTLPVTTFRPMDTSGARGAPRGVRLLEFVDVTGTLLTDRGPNTLLFDDLEIR